MASEVDEVDEVLLVNKEESVGKVLGLSSSVDDRIDVVLREVPVPPELVAAGLVVLVPPSPLLVVVVEPVLKEKSREADAELVAVGDVDVNVVALEDATAVEDTVIASVARVVVDLVVWVVASVAVDGLTEVRIIVVKLGSEEEDETCAVEVEPVAPVPTVSGSVATVLEDKEDDVV